MQNLRTLAVVAALLSGLGCDTVKKLRKAIHGEEQLVGPAAPEAAGLAVTVDPPVGISILLDGIKVATQSPYLSATLEPGPHTLHVRGMGYISITLPVVLKKHEVLRVPVSLRPRQPVRDGPDFSDPVPSRSEPQPRVPLPAPAFSPELPAGTAPLEVHWIAQPATAALLDGQRLEGRTLRIHRQSGVFQVGNLTLPYLVTGSRVLDFTIPSDHGEYTRDGTPLRPGTVIHLLHGATRIRRAGADASEQSVILKRLD